MPVFDPLCFEARFLCSYGGGGMDGNDRGYDGGYDGAGNNGGGGGGGGGGANLGSGANLGPNANPGVFGSPAPNPASVTSSELPDLTTPARSYNNAIDRADDFNSSVGGLIAGLLGFEKKASEEVPGQVDTTWGFNPVNIGLNLATSGTIGTLADQLGLTDWADIEAVNFNDLPSASNNPSTTAYGGSGDDDLTGPQYGPVGFASAFSDQTPLGASESVLGDSVGDDLAGYAGLYDDLAVPDGPGTNFDIMSQDTADQASPKKSLLPELAVAAALAIELA